jgi:colicin import membrane protein
LGNTPGTNESHKDEAGECHTSPRKDARPLGKKKAKEQQHQGKKSGSLVQKIYMNALETMWNKKKECEDLKERERERKEHDDMFFALEQQRFDEKKVTEQEKKLEEKKAMEQKKIADQMALEKTKHEEKMAMEKKRLQQQERELDDKVMAMDLNGMNELQQEYHMRMQQEILA